MGLRAILKKLDVHDGREFYRGIKSSSLKPVARVFVWSNTRVAHLLALPVDLVAQQIVFREALSDNDEQRKQRRSRRARDALAMVAEKEIATLARSDSHYARGMQTLLQVAAVTAWTTAEFCLRDVWITCVSERPDRVPPEMLAKIKIDAPTLFAMGLDARDRFGELLASSEFGFDNPTRMRTAYTALFSRIPHVDHAIGLLHTLHEIRNLIVHRGGIVDNRFRSKTHYRTKSGRPLVLSERKLVEYANAATGACKHALTFADGWLGATRKRRRR